MAESSENKPQKKPKRVFRPRARLMLLLGDELIRDSGIAVFELVKNAYDADARHCSIRLEGVADADPEQARIVIQDDGSGMDLKTILKVWLQPGTDNRREQKEAGQRTPKYNRRPLGEKGVGRFAVHKLGRVVRVVTRKRNGKEYVITIDWKDFEEGMLEDIPVRVRARKPLTFPGQEHGTRIEVSAINDLPWTRRRVRNLHRSITSICSPLGGFGRFRATLTLKPKLDWLDGLLTAREVLDRAIFRFKATLEGRTMRYQYSFNPPGDMDRVDERSNVVDTFPLLGESDFEAERSEGQSIVGELELPENTPPGSRQFGTRLDLSTEEIGRVEIELYIYDLERRTLKMTTDDPGALRDYLSTNGGVRVYRDGMRVYDFGEPGNDWLDLGSKRVNVPASRIGNNQVIGIVTLNAESSTGLIEKTNREGFVENEAYRIFREAIGSVVSQAAAERNIDKDRIRIAYSTTKAKEPVLDDLEELRDELKSRKLEKELGPIVDRVVVQYRGVTDKLLTAAGAGLNLAVVLHQVDKDIRYLRIAIEKDAKKADLERIAGRLANMTDSLSWLLRDSPNATQKASVFVHHAIDAWKFRYETHKVNVINGFSRDSKDFEFHGSRRLILTCLMNLIDNSIYWLRSRSADRTIYIGSTLELGKPALVVADNGPGILDPSDMLVQAFFTRKQSGMGLGLHIADEIMKQHGGRLVFPEEGQVSLPKGLDGAVVALQFGGGK